MTFSLWQSICINLLRTFGVLQVFVGLVTPVVAGGLSSFMRFDVVNTVEAGSAFLSGLLMFLLISLAPASPLVTWCALVFTAGIVSVLIKL